MSPSSSSSNVSLLKAPKAALHWKKAEYKI